MKQILDHCDLFEGLEPAQKAPFLEIAKRRTLVGGEYLFLLGETADRLFVVLEGSIETCFPLSIGGELRDVAVETKMPGSTLGWSALIKPYRFTLSARAAEPAKVAALTRPDLLRVLEADCHTGEKFMFHLAEIIGRRLLIIQALWARELQRAVAGGWVGLPAPGEGA